MSVNNALRFYDLETKKKLRYMELSNKIDARLGEKFVKRIPLRATMAFLTGGTSLIFSTGRQIYQLCKKSNAIAAVKSFVENERGLRGCTYVEWNTFPQAHIVIGGAPMSPTGDTVKCPLCKRFEMRKVVVDCDHEIMSCNYCNRIIAVKMNRSSFSPQELLIPGMFATAIPFTDGVEYLGDIVLNTYELLGDAAGFALDMLG